jgi:hypothetical protein
MWKIRLGLAFAALDVVLLVWLVGEHGYRWFSAGLIAQ